MLSRRPSPHFFLSLGIFIGVFLLSWRKLGKMCLDGTYCLDSFQPEHVDVGGLPPGTQNNAVLNNGTTPLSATASIEASGTTTTVFKTSLSRPTSRPEDDCAHFPDTSSVLLVMKTGASESYARIPTQALTNLKCLPEFLIFSDMKQEIAGYRIHDSLDTVLDSVRTPSNEDFQIYFRQRDCSVDQQNCNRYADTASEGWALDKYKNIHMAEKTFNMRPDYDWYLFVDADTYVVWPTLMQWLKRLDPSERHYLGSAAMLGDFPFGHGGSGYLVSNPAMREFFEGKTNVANKWDEAIREVCCGDYMFAKALSEETGIHINNMWPTINGEKPFTIPYSEREWCQPIVTMHHVNSEEVSELDAFERQRKFASPTRFKDLYHRFVARRLMPSRENWDNMSDEVFYLNASAREYMDWELNRVKTDNLSPYEMEAHLSFDHCRRACEADGSCLQFRFHQGICGMSGKIKVGYPVEEEEQPEDRWLSGWDVAKIRMWVRDHDDCGDEVVWPLVSEAKEAKEHSYPSGPDE